jgi:hypothetical protein
MIRDAYDQVAKIIAARGQSPEDFTVADEVERLRLAWKPSPVRVVMLAESHVWTSALDAKSRVHQPNGNNGNKETTGFARFVYCLGYGEPSLVEPYVPRNHGTPQYWRLFHDAVHGPDAPLTEIRQRDRTKRALAKLELLKELKLAGIWLVDASVIALYPRVVSGNDYKSLLQACWEAHIANVVAGCSPSAVLIVGKEVNKALGDLVAQAVPQAEICVVKQPNARMTHDEIYEDRLKVFHLCRRHRSN